MSQNPDIENENLPQVKEVPVNERVRNIFRYKNLDAPLVPLIEDEVTEEQVSALVRHWLVAAWKVPEGNKEFNLYQSTPQQRVEAGCTVPSNAAFPTWREGLTLEVTRASRSELPVEYFATLEEEVLQNLEVYGDDVQFGVASIITEVKTGPYNVVITDEATDGEFSGQALGFNEPDFDRDLFDVATCGEILRILGRVTITNTKLEQSLGDWLFVVGRGGKLGWVREEDILLLDKAEREIYGLEKDEVAAETEYKHGYINVSTAVIESQDGRLILRDVDDPEIKEKYPHGELTKPVGFGLGDEVRIIKRGQQYSILLPVTDSTKNYIDIETDNRFVEVEVRPDMIQIGEKRYTIRTLLVR